MNEAVPLVDLRAVHADLKAPILADLARLIEDGAFTNGWQVAKFEDSFAEYCGVRQCVGVSSGLDALRLALLAGGAGVGDEVILPANTFAATVEAVIQTGAKPVLVDVRESDYNVDPEAVDAAVTARTRFLLPVHLYGQMADLRTLAATAERHGLGIVEDACQAHGAERDGIRAGAAGLAGAFSFYPAKNLGAFGDAGAVVTDDGKLASTARALREHGQRRKYEHELQGYTARLDTVNALVLLRKLPLVDVWNEQRRAAARVYTAQLEGVGDLVLPQVPEASRPVWHLYVVRTSDPDRLRTFLQSRAIGTGRHYPQPPHLSPAYRALGLGRGDFPVTERLAGEVLSLPIFPGISDGQLGSVVAAVQDYFGRG